MSQDEEQRRAHFRLRYPEKDRPRFARGADAFLVTELSEGGMRLHLAEPKGQWTGPASIDGHLRLASGARLEVSGEFLREADGEVVFQLQRGVDLHDMLEEQKFLVRKYPAMFGRERD